MLSPFTSDNCRRIFEARKCVQKLTVECDDTTKLAVSIDLEAVVKVVNGVKCEEKAVIPKCRAVLAERVKSILSYDPLDPEDPSYDQVIAGNNTEDQQPETGEEPFVPTYLGRLCQDAHLAFQCVQEGLQEFPIGPSEGFFEILNVSWTLALTRCRGKCIASLTRVQTQSKRLPIVCVLHFLKHVFFFPFMLYELF